MKIEELIEELRVELTTMYNVMLEDSSQIINISVLKYADDEYTYVYGLTSMNAILSESIVLEKSDEYNEDGLYILDRIIDVVYNQ